MDWELVGAGVDATDIVRLVADACKRHPDRAALIFEDGEAASRAEFQAAIEHFGGYLTQRVEPGERVAIMLDNRVEFMVAWIAVAACGGILVSISAAAREYDARHILSDSESVIVVVGEASEQLILSLQPECPALREIVVVRGPEPTGLDHHGDVVARFDLDRVEVDSNAVTNIYYTSGTTGLPKACMLGHRYWLRFADLYLRLYGLSARQRLLCCLQFSYGDPPWQMLASLQAGTSLVAMRRFSVSRFWDVVRAHRVTNLFGIASIPSLLLKAPSSESDLRNDVDFALQIGVPTNLHGELDARWGFPWLEGYGLTETGLVIAMPRAYAAEMAGSGAIGLPCPGVEVRLLGDADEEVADGQVGEIVVHAPGLMHGYLNRPDATAEVLRDGWLHTGDIGRRDERGFLYFIGRKKDIIRRSGENVAAAEVEQLLRSHPRVLEAAVIPVPDDLRGEEVKAYVVLVEGETPDTLSPEQIVEFCSDRLAKYKVPRYIAYQDTLPRTPSMRVKKADLAAEAGDLTAGAWDREAELGW